MIPLIILGACVASSAAFLLGQRLGYSLGFGDGMGLGERRGQNQNYLDALKWQCTAGPSSQGEKPAGE